MNGSMKEPATNSLKGPGSRAAVSAPPPGISFGPRILAALSLAGMVVLITLIIFSSFEMSLGAGLALMVESLWGVTTLVDLYFGLIFIALWIGFVERSALRALPWFLALMFTGNLALLAYLSWRGMRCRTLREVFTGHPR
jgi:hypothetical protein